jgi:exopolysaccharide biosynthesis protein
MARTVTTLQSLALVLLAGALLAPQASATGVSTAHITAIAWQAEGQIGKVLIRLDAPVTYRTIASSSSIVVDLWRARHMQWDLPHMIHSYVEGVRINQLTDELARVRIDLWRPARYKTFLNDESHTLTIVVIPPWMATAPLPDSVAYEKLRVRTGAGTTTVHAVLVNPQDPILEIRPALAADMVSGAETTSVIATRYEALAGINGGYFDEKSGLPLGMLVIDGELMTTPTDRRSVFAITMDGKPVIVPFEFTGRIMMPDRSSLWVSGVNQPPSAGGVSVYTRFYGPLTPSFPVAAIVRNSVVEQLSAGKILIPLNGYVLVTNAADAGLITQFIKIGARLQLQLVFSPNLEIRSALGGGPRLVKDGQVFVPFAWEWFSSRHARRRAPRTAVGITETGKLLLVTVDGGTPQNTGMTLPELAEVMVRLGARDAMNLDGGGSATMVVGGRVVNDPSDGIERPIASALLVLRRTAPVIPVTGSAGTAGLGAPATKPPAQPMQNPHMRWSQDNDPDNVPLPTD